MQSSFSKFIGISAIAISATILPLSLPASAQVITPGVERRDAYENNDFDWGWLGLIGLFGLAGLAGKNKRQETTTTYQDAGRENPTLYRDPDPNNRID